MKSFLRTELGFTFTEVILVIAIMGLMAGLAIPFYQSFQITSDLDNTTQALIQTLRRAQSKAMASENFSDFGVHFEPGSFTLIKGSSYNPADPYNEVVEVANSITINSGAGADIIFAVVQGTTSNTGIITISATSGQSRQMTINNYGVVNAL